MAIFQHYFSLTKFGMFLSFIEALEKEIAKGLPGKKGQAQMKPYLKISPSLDAPASIVPKESAVLCLFFPIEDVPHIAMIERPKYDGVHSGQIAFPGGKRDKGDIDLEYTALREAEEEVGIKRENTKIIGKLTEVYVLASNFQVTPFIGYSLEKPTFILEEREVAQVLEVPVNYFLKENIIFEKPIGTRFNFTLMAPYYDLNGKTLWGATAMMISELMTIIKRI